MVSGWTVTLACSTIAAPAETIQSSGTLYPDSEVGPDLLTIPVVIFSTSQAETDIAASYQLHANAYITKPVSLDLFTEAIRQVDDFFLTLVKLPAED
jgi:DNA-binding NarL/FixJ family response regulator